MDVTLFNVDNSIQWCTFKEHQIPVMSQDLRLVEGRIDKAVATMWTTVAFLENYQNIEKRYYLVQNFETDFYEPGVSAQSICKSELYPEGANPVSYHFKVV